MSTVNVNLKKCDCSPVETAEGLVHRLGCSSEPLPLPCPTPRTVEMTVRLGGCQCWMPAGHRSDCKDKPIRVTVSIGGETWATSKPDGVTAEDMALLQTHRLAVWEDVCARWEFVKALLLNDYSYALPDSDNLGALLAQRDAVFAALCKMARAEQDAYEAETHWGLAMGRPASDDVRHPDPPFDANILPSQRRLTAYVSHLIATVGAI